MVLDKNGSLKIRNVLIEDSGNYDCGGNTSTILYIKERNTKEKDMETNLQSLPRFDCNEFPYGLAN